MPLELAIRKEQKKVTEIPVSNGARPNQSSSQNSLLHAACDLGNLQVVNILLKHGANPCALNSNGNTPLWLAVCQGHLEVVKILLQYYIKSSSCSEQSIDSPSALYAAAYYNHMAIAELLIKAGADVNKRNSKGKTALHAACTNENFPLVNLLLEKGALVNAGSVFIATPIHEAVLKGNPEIVQRLIAAGADVNMVCREQDILGLEGSPLHVAVSGGNKEMISVLCSGQGVDVNVRNFHGQTPLVVAIVSGFAAAETSFRSHAEQGPVTAITVPMLTSVLISLRRKNSQGLSEVSPKGSTFREDVGAGLLNMCGTLGFSDDRKSISSTLHHMLIRAGAFLQAKDAFKHSALDYAVLMGKVEAACLLMCHGATLDMPLLRSLLSGSCREAIGACSSIATLLTSLPLLSPTLQQMFCQLQVCAYLSKDKLDYMHRQLRRPMCLTRLCRAVVRESLAGQTAGSVAPLVAQLPVPSSVQDFLLLSDLWYVVTGDHSGAFLRFQSCIESRV
ncbi:hypothetical protein C0Q70_05752 [Pomacea canaliculata]|uniref:SOCS box domain-containing protein n=1 Tax=Pomacea canaliculata TaxID=400727 RepID=A0A2T7PM69_POMCA|nr:hypothetical protein C0Q70_05752 [Pomacea canaliculata]